MRSSWRSLVLHVAVVSAETIDRVLAVVAGQLIMLSDVNAVRDLGIVNRRQERRSDRLGMLAG